MGTLENYFGYLTDYANSSAEEEFTSAEATDFFTKEFKKRDTGAILKSLLQTNAELVPYDAFCEVFNRDNVEHWKQNLPISREKSFELAICFEMTLI